MWAPPEYSLTYTERRRPVGVNCDATVATASMTVACQHCQHHELADRINMDPEELAKQIAGEKLMHIWESCLLDLVRLSFNAGMNADLDAQRELVNTIVEWAKLK